MAGPVRPGGAMHGLNTKEEFKTGCRLYFLEYGAHGCKLRATVKISLQCSQFTAVDFYQFRSLTLVTVPSSAQITPEPSLDRTGA